MTKTTVGIVDDHNLVVKSLAMMISNFNSFSVTLEAYGGQDLIEKCANLSHLPDIILIDVNMPEMDGYAVTDWLIENHPNVKPVALSMNNDDMSIFNMIKAGCCAYIFKTVTHFELEKALLAVSKEGFYNENINLNRMVKKQEEADKRVKLSEQEQQFLNLACTEFTYMHIAKELGLSQSRVDDIRASVFSKLNAKSRVALVLEAVRKGFVKL